MTDPVSLSDAREHLGELVAKAEHAGEPIVLTRRGHAAAAIVPMDVLRAWQEYQDECDLQAAREALAQPERIPHEDVLREFGLA